MRKLPKSQKNRAGCVLRDYSKACSCETVE